MGGEEPVQIPGVLTALTLAPTSPGGRGGEDPLLTLGELTVVLAAVVVGSGGRAISLEACPASQPALVEGPDGAPVSGGPSWLHFLHSDPGCEAKQNQQTCLNLQPAP